jgi:hypothetical protein
MLNHAVRKSLLDIAFSSGMLVCVLLFGLPASMGAQSADPTESRGRNTNEVFAELGRSVPEFGGIFIDEQRNDTLDVYVLGSDPELAAKLDAAINAIPELASARAAQTRIQLLPAQYSFLQLKDWHDRASPVLLAMPDVILTAVDQQANRLLVGISDWAVAADITEALSGLDVPRSAVNLEFVQPQDEMPMREEATPTSEAAPDQTTLQSRIRPLVGGIQITRRSGDSTFACTLGFIAERSRVSGLVTNSHCTEVPGGVENSAFYQPTTEDANKVATESVDPCYFWRGPEPSFPPRCEPIPRPIPAQDMCEDKDACRYSDSAFATLENGVQVSLAFIARPTQEGTINWNPPDTFFKIVGEQSVVMPGTFVSLVGRTTGWKSEVVRRVCVNQKITRTISGKQQVYNYLCQNLASGAGDSGDSGSPVFACIDNSNPPRIIECPGRVAVGQKNVNVKLVGLRWAILGGSTRNVVYSPIGSMTDGTVKGVQNSNNDLGPLKKCAEGDC